MKILYYIFFVLSCNFSELFLYSFLCNFRYVHNLIKEFLSPSGRLMSSITQWTRGIPSYSFTAPTAGAMSATKKINPYPGQTFPVKTQLG